MPQHNFRNRGPKRPVDKEIVNILKTAIGTGQVALTLRTAGMAETLSGIRGNLSGKFGANAGSVGMVIAVVREGQTASTLDLTDGGTLYAPQQDVLFAWFGHGSPAVTELHWQKIDVKAMRKLKDGDTIQILLRCTAADTVDVTGSITSFYKQ